MHSPELLMRLARQQAQAFEATAARALQVRSAGPTSRASTHSLFGAFRSLRTKLSAHNI